MPIQYDEGSYLGELVRHEFGESTNKKTPQIRFVFQITYTAGGKDGPIPVETSSERSFYLYLTENTAERTVEILRKMGWNGTDFYELDHGNPKGHSFAGKEVPLTCKHEEDQNGVAREKWDYDARQEAKPLERQKFQHLNSTFGYLTRATAPPKPAVRGPVSRKDEGDVV